MTAEERQEQRQDRLRRGDTFTRRQYLMYQAVMDGANAFLAMEAVSTTALEHPEWDMEEQLTWEQWEGLHE